MPYRKSIEYNVLFFCMIYSTGQINVCTDFDRSIGSELTKLENMNNSMFYLTSRDVKTVRRTSLGLS